MFSVFILMLVYDLVIILSLFINFFFFFIVIILLNVYILFSFICKGNIYIF